jgi:hypothetical protein
MMRLAAVLSFVLMFAVAVHAQVPKPTELHGFVLGSTWEQVEPLAAQYEAASVAKYPSSAQMETADYKRNVAKILMGQEAELAVPDNFYYRLTFRNRILVQAKVAFGQDHATSEQLLADATAKYGKPASTGSTTAQNALARSGNCMQQCGIRSQTAVW